MCIWKERKEEVKKEIVVDLDLSDFREVKDLYLSDKLNKFEKKEGKKDLSDLYKICFTNHAYHRCFEEQDRNCTYEKIEELLLLKSKKIVRLALADKEEEFAVVSDDAKLALFCVKTVINGYPSIILKTVVRKVFYTKDGVECEEDVKVKRNNRKL